MFQKLHVRSTLEIKIANVPVNLLSDDWGVIKSLIVFH